MNEARSDTHLHALAWSVVTLVLTLVAEDILSGLAVATAAGSLIFGVATLTRRASVRVYLAAVLAIVVSVIGGLMAISKVMAPQFF